MRRRNRVVVRALAHALFAGDWHDKPLKWEAAGPGERERQCFATKKDATVYAKLRRDLSERDAHTAYLDTPEDNQNAP